MKTLNYYVFTAAPLLIINLFHRILSKLQSITSDVLFYFVHSSIQCVWTACMQANQPVHYTISSSVRRVKGVSGLEEEE